MKHIYKVSWTLFVKIGHDESAFKPMERFYQSKEDAERAARDLESYYKQLGFTSKLGAFVSEVEIK